MYGIWAKPKEIPARAMDIFDLMKLSEKLGLEGLQITAVDCESTDREQLSKVRRAALNHHLYLEYNFSLNEKFDTRLNNTIEDAIDISASLGADIAKISMDIERPRPVGASRHDPIVMKQLETIAVKLANAAPKAEKNGVKLAVENHTETFASEIKWLVDQVNHPWVGACIDTVNSLAVLEDPLVAVEVLAPIAFVIHFKDSEILKTPYGLKFRSVACGDGDIDLKSIYDTICQKSDIQRITIEVELSQENGSLKMARARELEAVKRSIRFCRDTLGIRN
jgi:sugar phosphate isomerase/epimerase